VTVRTADLSEAEAIPSSGRPGRVARVAGWGGIVAVASIAPAVLLPVRTDLPVRITHSDAFGYAWQIRVLGAAPPATVGARPGVAGIGAVLDAFHVLPDQVGPLVLGLAMAVCLALACGAAVRMAFRLPAWTVGIVAGFVVLWGGTARMGIGYLSNLVSLTCFVAAAWASCVPRRGRFPVAAAVFAFAAGLANPGFLPAYAGIAVTWTVLSIPRILRDRRTGRSVLSAEPAQLLIALGVASVASAVVLFAVMRLHPGDLATFQVEEFGERLGKAAGRIFIPISVVLALTGIVVAWLSRSGRASRVMGGLGIAWSAVALGGAALTLVVHSFPGQRALLVLLPMPIAMGIGTGGGIGLATGIRSSPVLRTIVVVAAAAASAAAVGWTARPAVELYQQVAGTPSEWQPNDVMTYVEAVRPNVPVVVVMDPANERGIRLWKTQLNEIRAFAPRDTIARIVPYLGTPELALAGSPTTADGAGTTYGASFQRVSTQLWRDFAEELRNPASIVVVPRAYVGADTWAGVTRDPTTEVTPNLAVIRGPRIGPLVVRSQPTLSARRTWADAVACLLVLSVIGAGFGAATVRPRGGSWLDAAALAPAIGTVALILSGLGVALVGADPTGPAGTAVAVVVAITGIGWAALRTRRARSTIGDELPDQIAGPTVTG
jgi:hypothetical protein